MDQKLLLKKLFPKKKLFLHFLPLAGKTVDVMSNLRELFRKGVNRAIECAFRGTVALLVPELCVGFLEIVVI